MSVVSDMLRIFQDEPIADLAVAAWSISLNSFLDDRAPKDLLATDPESVIKAAQDQMHEVNQM
jgi:hypothetical protein